MKTLNQGIGMIDDGFDYMATPMPHEDVQHTAPKFDDGKHAGITALGFIVAVPLAWWLISLLF
jgi:hypothetical protein